MKKIIIVIVALLAAISVANAQPRSIGLRAGYGGELSYQHSFGSNFGEFDLGWFSHGFNITGIYDFVLGSADKFNFYAGPGASMGFYKNGEDEGFNLGIAGQLGLEYNFDIPLTLSLDWRPEYYFNFGGVAYDSVALGIRYRF